MFWGIAGAVAVLVVAAFLYALWRVRQRNRTRLVSFVALLSEPKELDTAILARIAGEVWDADLGDGTSEGAEGFVVGVGAMNTIRHGERMYLVNSIPAPYVDNVDQVADSVSDLRTQELFRQHQAWFSCDAFGVPPSATDDELNDWYQRLAKLFVALLDEQCLLIYLPENSLIYPINEETEAALRSDDPRRALQDSLTVPVVSVKDDDPLMQRAVQKARDEWPRFVEAFGTRAGENFAIKAPITRNDHTEFIWISVTCIEGDRVYGTLGNDPANLGSLKFGSKVSAPVAELNDWCFINPQQDLVGGFTIEAVKQASKRRK